MTPQLKNRLTELLLAKEADLLADFQRARERLSLQLVTDKSAGDRVDEAGIFADHDLAARHINLNRALLGQVRIALQAMEQGVYGRCLACDCQIPAKRLLASPWASYCVGCQERIEQENGAAGSKPARTPIAHQRYGLAG